MSDKSIEKDTVNCEIIIKRDDKQKSWGFIFLEMDKNGKKTGRAFFADVNDKEKKTVYGGM